MPEDAADSYQPSSLNSLGQIGSSGGSSSLGSFGDLANVFSWKNGLKSADKKHYADTQSRTKDIPTAEQLIGDYESKNKEARRRFRIVAVDSYVMPFLSYLMNLSEKDEE